MSVVIPKLKDSDPASAATFNRPLTVIESALNSLTKSVNTSMSGSSLLAKTVPVSDDCFVGALVYFDSKAGEFRPAIAAVEDSDIRPGSLVTSKRSAVVGMIVQITNNRIGDILIQGKYTSAECLANCLQTNVPGTYYLSDTVAGKASTNYTIIAQPVLTYTGGSDFILNITYQIPYQYSGSVIRGVTTDSELIRTSVSDRGVLTISTNDFVDAGESMSPTAISSISGTTYRKTPVLTNAVGVGQIKAIVNSAGELTIGDINSLGGKIQAYEYNLNGARRASDDIYTYIVFPAGRASSVTFSTRVSCTDDVKAYVWVHAIDNSNSSPIDAQIYVVPDPSLDSDTAMPGSYTKVVSMSLKASSGLISMIKSEDFIDIPESCYVFVRLTASAPVSDIKIMDAGLIIEPSDSTHISYSGADYSSLSESLRTAESILKDQVVGVNSEGLLVAASCDNHSVQVVGIASENAAKGDTCTYTTYGTHLSSSSIEVGSSYFVGLNGRVTTSMPDSPSYAQRIGTGVGTNQLRIDIEDRIL